jgi:hypothetical protein
LIVYIKITKYDMRSNVFGNRYLFFN